MASPILYTEDQPTEKGNESIPSILLLRIPLNLYHGIRAEDLRGLLSLSSLTSLWFYVRGSSEFLSSAIKWVDRKESTRSGFSSSTGVPLVDLSNHLLIRHQILKNISAEDWIDHLGLYFGRSGPHFWRSWSKRNTITQANSLLWEYPSFFFGIFEASKGWFLSLFLLWQNLRFVFISQPFIFLFFGLMCLKIHL